MITLRVYDAACVRKKYAEYADRYTLYIPTPKKFIRKWGYFGVGIGFNFGDDGRLIRFSSFEVDKPIACMSMGKKLKRESLPKHVQDWINNLEILYNKALKEDTDEAWDAFNQA